jgi:hypothetical protein
MYLMSKNITRSTKILFRRIFMKSKVIILAFVMITALLVGCAPPAETPPTETPPQTTPPETTPDVVTTASIVDDEAAFEKAISNTGTWIICTLKDLTFDKELVLDGEFKNGKKDDAGKDVIQRKIALYTQDDKRNVTARFTLTAPKLTISSPMASIQHGTFKGDLYVTTKDFQLVDTTVDGNVYFTTDDAKSGFKMDDKSKVTGKQEVKK